jgi:RNA polymerase sigma factor (sigma-70 family)
MPIKSVSDQQLVAMYRRGNHSAFAELLNRHKDRVYTAIFLLVKDEVLAEDLFQDTFIKVIEILKEGKYAEEGKFLPWVLRIAHNLCMDYFRRTSRMPKVITQDGSDIFNVLYFEESAADKGTIQAETATTVRELMAQLPEEQREVLILRHYADLSFKEIAAITDVSINTALGRMRYALMNMRKMIVEQQIIL